MKFNYIQILCDLGYKFIKNENERIMWFQKKVNEYTVKDIMICFKDKVVNCETNFYNRQGTLLKRECNMTFEELKIVNEILKENYEE